MRSFKQHLNEDIKTSRADVDVLDGWHKFPGKVTMIHPAPEGEKGHGDYAVQKVEGSAQHGQHALYYKVNDPNAEGGKGFRWELTAIRPTVGELKKHVQSHYDIRKRTGFEHPKFENSAVIPNHKKSGNL